MTRLAVPVGPDDHSQGPDDAPVTIVQYGSYDCSHCLQSLPIVDEVKRRYAAPLRFVYRHFPAETPRSASERAAEAAEAAGSQGKFWEMHAHLLRNQHALDDASLLAHAALVGINVRQFAADLEAHTWEPRVREHFEGGRASGVHSTPTYFINGVRHDDFWDAETLLAAVAAATPGALVY